MKKIAVFGDIMLDKYIIGSVDRISPEASVPIVKVDNEKYMPGGSANVAANISTLKGKAYLFGFVGSDSAKFKLYEQFEKYNINKDNVYENLDKTTQKIRVVVHDQQLVRIDIDNNIIISDYNNYFFECVTKNNFDGIIISDYAKGVIHQELVEKLKDISLMKQIPIFVDPKPINKNLYKNVFLITPNKQEAELMTGFKNINDIIFKLRDDLHCNVAITLGEEGIALLKLNDNNYQIHSTKVKEVYDVTGAGDTVIAAITMSIIHNYSIDEAIRIANVAAGIKVGKHGTAPISLEELGEYYYINWE